MNVRNKFNNNGIDVKSPGKFHNGLTNGKARNGRKTPLISIIVPVYQEEKIIPKTLKIFTKDLQKKYNFELIISDGGSTDKTIEIAKKFADKIVIHDKDRKQTISEGRNRGADAAEGDILCFINADTIPEDPAFFFQKIQDWSLRKNGYSQYDAIACYVKPFPEEMIFKDVLFYKIHNWYVMLLNKFGMGMGRGECQIMRKEIFNSTGGYDENIAAGEDFDLYRRISKIGKVYFAKELKVVESPRRFRKYGYLRIIMSWLVNALSVMFFKKSYSKEWEAVR